MKLFYIYKAVLFIKHLADLLRRTSSAADVRYPAESKWICNIVGISHNGQLKLHLVWSCLNHADLYVHFTSGSLFCTLLFVTFVLKYCLTKGLWISWWNNFLISCNRCKFKNVGLCNVFTGFVLQWDNFCRDKFEKQVARKIVSVMIARSA